LRYFSCFSPTQHNYFRLPSPSSTRSSVIFGLVVSLGYPLERGFLGTTCGLHTPPLATPIYSSLLDLCCYLYYYICFYFLCISWFFCFCNFSLFILVSVFGSSGLFTHQTTFTCGPDSWHPCQTSFDPHLQKHCNRVLAFLIFILGYPTLVVVISFHDVFSFHVTINKK